MSATIVYNKLPGLAARIEAAAGAAIQEGAEAIAERYRANVHVITGETRDSIEARQTGPMSSEVTAKGGALYEELGTRFMAAHPSAIPAYDATVPEIIRNVESAIKGAVG